VKPELYTKLWSIKSSLVIIYVSWLKITDVSGTIFVPHHQALMMGTEMVPETSVIFNQLMRRTAREDYIDVSSVKALDHTQLWLIKLNGKYNFSYMNANIKTDLRGMGCSAVN
jgi:hypothetical protein